MTKPVPPADSSPLSGLVLPILGALPDAFIIAVSGLGGSQEEAQEQVLTVNKLIAS